MSRKEENRANAADEKNEFNHNEPRERYLRKLRRIWLSCAVAGMMLMIIGNFASDKWKTDIGILCFILVAVCVTYFLCWDYLAKKWGLDKRDEDE